MRHITKQEENNEYIWWLWVFLRDAVSSYYGNHAGSHLCFLTFTIKHYSCFQIPLSARNNQTLLGPI